MLAYECERRKLD